MLYIRYIEHPTLTLVLYPTTNKKTQHKNMSSKWLALVGAGMHTKDATSGGVLTPAASRHGGVWFRKNFRHENWMTSRFHGKFRGSMIIVVFSFSLETWVPTFIRDHFHTPNKHKQSMFGRHISLLMYVDLSSASTKCRPISYACHGYYIIHWKSMEIQRILSESLVPKKSASKSLNLWKYVLLQILPLATKYLQLLRNI